MGFYYNEELGEKSEYYNDAVIWFLLGYTVWYYEDYSLCRRLLLS